MSMAFPCCIHAIPGYHSVQHLQQHLGNRKARFLKRLHVRRYKGEWQQGHNICSLFVNWKTQMGARVTKYVWVLWVEKCLFQQLHFRSVSSFICRLLVVTIVVVTRFQCFLEFLDFLIPGVDMIWLALGTFFSLVCSFPFHSGIVNFVYLLNVIGYFPFVLLCMWILN